MGDVPPVHLPLHPSAMCGPVVIVLLARHRRGSDARTQQHGGAVVEYSHAMAVREKGAKAACAAIRIDLAVVWTALEEPLCNGSAALETCGGTERE